MEYTIISTRTLDETYYTTVIFDFIEFQETTEIPHNIGDNESAEEFKNKVEQTIKNVGDSFIAKRKRIERLSQVGPTIEIGVSKSLE